MKFLLEDSIFTIRMISRVSTLQTLNLIMIMFKSISYLMIVIDKTNHDNDELANKKCRSTINN